MGRTISLNKQNAPSGGGLRADELAPGLAGGVRNNGGRRLAALTPGTTLSLTYGKIEGGKAVLSADKPFSGEWRVDAASVEGSPGDVLRFTVIKNGKNGLSLRQVLTDKPQARAEGQLNGSSLIEMLREHRLIPGDEPESPGCFSGVDELQLKKARALGKIRRELACAKDRATPDAIRELLASGVNLEKISLTMLNSALAEIEAGPPENDVPPGGAAAGSLTRRGLPLSARNLAALESVRCKIPDRLEDEQIAAVIRSGKPVTVETVYIGQFSNGGRSREETDAYVSGFERYQGEPPVSGPRAALGGGPEGGAWDEIKNSLEALFRREGVENSGENTEAARFLVKHGLPVSGENIEKYNFLIDIKNRTDLGRIFDRAAQKIRDGASPLGAELMETGPEPDALSPSSGISQAELKAEYAYIARALPGMTAGHVDALAERGLPVSLRNLRDIARELPAPPETRTDDDSLAAKRQLAEIQLKLTHEAANRLMGKNIRIDTLPLREVLEELRAAERDACARSLRAAGAADAPENVSAMAELYDKLGGLRPLTSSVFGDIIRKNADFSVNGVHRSVTAARKSVLDSLEAFATAPDPRYGDSFRLVKERFSGFLAGIGVEPTDGNVRAAAILSRNGMDIDEGSLLEVRTIDGKIEAVASSLHPRIAASIIKDGLNPLDMDIDEVLGYIGGFENQYGNGLKDKIAAAIAEMDRKSEMEPRLREAVVAVYRALGLIERNGGAALGTALKSVGKSGAELTLGRLMEAAKYFQRTGGGRTDKNILIDRNFGELEKAETSESGIRKTLEERRAEHGALAGERERTEEKAGTPESGIRKTLEERRAEYGALAGERERTEEKLGTPESDIRKTLEERRAEYGALTGERERTEEKAETSENGIRKTLEERRAEYAALSVSRFAERAVGHTDALSGIIQDRLNWRNVPLAQLSEELPEAERSRVSGQAAELAMNRLNVLTRTPPGVVYWMEENGVPVSLQNAVAAQSLAANPFYAEEALDGLDEETKAEIAENILDADLSRLKDGDEPEDVLAGLRRGLEEAEYAGGERLRELRLIQNAVKVGGYVRGKDSFQLPIRLSGGISGLNMYVINEAALEDGEAKVYMALKTKNLGAVRVYFTRRGKTADVAIAADGPEAARRLRENGGALALALAEAGFEAGKVSFEADARFMNN